MKQYRITSSDYVPPAQDTVIPDAVLDEADLVRMQQLAGIAGPGIAEGWDKKAHAGNKNPSGSKSPVGSNISDATMEKHQLEHEHNIKPGSPEWFKLWFSRPYLTGEQPVGNKAPTGNTLFSRPSKT